MAAPWAGHDRRREPRKRFEVGVHLTGDGICIGEGVSKNKGRKSLFMALRCSAHRLKKDDPVAVTLYDLSGASQTLVTIPAKARIVRMQTLEEAKGIAVLFPEEIEVV